MKTCNNICLGNGSSGFQWFLQISDVGLIIGCCQDIVGDFCHVFRLFFLRLTCQIYFSTDLLTVGTNTNHFKLPGQLPLGCSLIL